MTGSKVFQSGTWPPISRQRFSSGLRTQASAGREIWRTNYNAQHYPSATTEGFERGSTADLLKFLYIARGSAGEVRSMLCVMDRMQRFDNLKSEISDLKSQFESTSRQIRAWADSLQNSEIKGQRHLNDKSRQQYEQSNRMSAFMKKQAEFKQQMEERLNREAKERANRQQQQTDGE